MNILKSTAKISKKKKEVKKSAHNFFILNKFVVERSRTMLKVLKLYL
jgi:hypothetical protein